MHGNSEAKREVHKNGKGNMTRRVPRAPRLLNKSIYIGSKTRIQYHKKKRNLFGRSLAGGNSQLSSRSNSII